MSEDPLKPAKEKIAELTDLAIFDKRLSDFYFERNLLRHWRNPQPGHFQNEYITLNPPNLLPLKDESK